MMTENTNDTLREEIIAAATTLGELLGKHPAKAKYDKVIAELNASDEAQRTLEAYNVCMQEVAQKEANKLPIEVEDKQQLKTCQEAVIANSILQELQVAQMEYVDLMHAIDNAVRMDDPAQPE